MKIIGNRLSYSQRLLDGVRGSVQVGAETSLAPSHRPQIGKVHILNGPPDYLRSTRLKGLGEINTVYFELP